MTEFNSFPIRRLRRFREKDFIRKILQENVLNVNDLIYPIFVSEDITEKQIIHSMPGIYRHSLETILYEIEKCSKLKIPAVAIFPVINQTKKITRGQKPLMKKVWFLKSLKKSRIHFLKLGLLVMWLLIHTQVMVKMVYVNSTEKLIMIKLFSYYVNKH